MKRKTKESIIVMIAPTQIGIPNKIFNAIDDPITSYKVLMLLQIT
jgi:hypothetical protein